MKEKKSDVLFCVKMIRWMLDVERKRREDRREKEIEADWKSES